MQDQRNTVEYVYLAGPIAGLTWEEANAWRVEFANKMPHYIHCLSPTRFKSFLGRQVIETKPYDVHPLSTDKGLTRRDLFDVKRSSAVLVNFIGADRVSVGTCIEIGAHALSGGSLLVVAMEEGNCHDHPMVREIADYIVPTLEEAARMLIAIL